MYDDNMASHHEMECVYFTGLRTQTCLTAYVRVLVKKLWAVFSPERRGSTYIRVLKFVARAVYNS